MMQIARDLGISGSALHAWRKQFVQHGNQAFPGKGRQTEHEEENRRLRQGNELLKQVREVWNKGFVSLRRNNHEVCIHSNPES